MASNSRSTRVLTRWDAGQLNELNSILTEIQGRVSTVEGRTGEVTVLGDQKIEGRLQLMELQIDDIPATSEVGSIYRTTSYQAQSELWGVEYDGELYRSMRLITRAFEEATEVGKASDWNFTDGLEADLDKSTDTLEIGIGAIGVSLIPDVDCTYDLGSASLRWSDIYWCGQALAPDTAWAYSFAADPDCGMYRNASNGSLRLRTALSGARTQLYLGGGDVPGDEGFFSLFSYGTDLNYGGLSYDTENPNAHKLFLIANGGSALELDGTNGTLYRNLLFSADNTLDIGANGATRPRSIYFGTTIVGASGGVGAPAYTFGTDTTAGLYYSGGIVVHGGAGDATIASGVGADVNLVSATGNIVNVGDYIPNADNTYDIGASATRFKSIYWGTQALAPNGTVGAPAYSFANDTDNGWYLPSAGNGWAYAINSGSGFFFNVGVPAVVLAANFALGWSQTPGNATASADVLLWREAAATLALRNSTVAQTFRVYNTYTDSGNYERGELAWDTNALYLRTAKAGTGTGRNIWIQPEDYLVVDATYLPATTNGYDLGSTSKLIRNIYWGTQALAPNGSVGTPAYSFASDTDTGLYYASGLVVGVAGTGRWYWDLSGHFIPFASDTYNIGESSGASGGGPAHIFAAAGAVGDPPYSFVGDPDTGLYSLSADNLGVAVGGVKVGVFEENAAGSYNGLYVFSNTGNGNLLAQVVDTGGSNFVNLQYINGSSAGNFYIRNNTSASLLLGTDSTDRMIVNNIGDTYFSGDSVGLPYGSCYGNEIAWTQASAVQNTWYAISDSDMTDGELNAVTHDGSGQLTVSIAGRYLMTWAIACEINTANKHIQITPYINGSASDQGMNHIEFSTANQQRAAGGCAIFDLAASSTVAVAVRTTDTGTPDISVDHLHFCLVHVGGT